MGDGMEQEVMASLPVSSARSHRERALRPQGLPRRQVLADTVYEAIKEQIMDHGLAPGSRVNMDHLARDLDVSTTPVREALMRLESEGLVTRQNLKGFTVTPQLNRTDLDELFTMRVLIEPEAASRAAITPDSELLDAIHAILAAASEQVNSGAEEQYRRYRTFIDSDERFHDAIAAASGNRLLRRTLAGLHSHALLYRLYFETSVVPEREPTAEEHQVIFDAIAARQPEQAAAAMRVHVECSRERALGRTSAILLL